MDGSPMDDALDIPAVLRRRAAPPPDLRNRILAACARERDDAWPWWQVLAAVFMVGLFLAAIAQPGGGDGGVRVDDAVMNRRVLTQLMNQE